MRKIITKTLCICATAGLVTFVTGCQTGKQCPSQSAVETTAPAVATGQPSAAPAVAIAPGVIRIKAGSSEPFKDSSGNVWQAELGFEGGDVVQHDAAGEIANTKD